MLVSHITHAYMDSRQEKWQASMQAREQSNGARQAGVRLAYSARGYTLSVDDATITYSYRSRRNYTRVELARKFCVLDSPTRRSMRARRLNATRRLGIESPEV